MPTRAVHRPAAARRRRRLPETVLALAVLGGGCASPSPPSSAPAGPPVQPVRIETPWCPGARCTAANALGEWTLDASPGTLLLQPSIGRLRVTCTAPGDPTRVAVAEVASTQRLPEGRPATRAGAAIGAGTGIGAGLLGASLFAGPTAPLVIILMGAGMGYYGGAVGAAFDELNRAPGYPDSVIVPLACPAAR